MVNNLDADSEDEGTKVVMFYNIKFYINTHSGKIIQYGSKNKYGDDDKLPTAIVTGMWRKDADELEEKDGVKEKEPAFFLRCFITSEHRACEHIWLRTVIRRYMGDGDKRALHIIRVKMSLEGPLQGDVISPTEANKTLRPCEPLRGNNKQIKIY